MFQDDIWGQKVASEAKKKNTQKIQEMNFTGKKLP